MKKIMIALSAIAMAVAANAATVNWSVSAVTAPTGVSGATGWKAVFVLGDTLPTFPSTAADFATWAASNADSEGSLTWTSRSKTFSGSSADKFAASANVTGYIVMFDNADISKATNYAYTTPDTKQVPSSGNLGWATTFASTSGWKAIPEPTSGLLLLLGVAGLALRRKQK